MLCELTAEVDVNAVTYLMLSRCCVCRSSRHHVHTARTFKLWHAFEHDSASFLARSWLPQCLHWL